MAMLRSQRQLSDGWQFACSMAVPEGELRSAEDLRVAGLTLMACKLPASFYLDMHMQGLVDDPRDITNLPDFSLYEYAHVWYVCTFQDVDVPEDASVWLAFERIDCFAQVYLNGRSIGSTDNALVPHRFLADGLVRGENELVVHIRPTMVEAQRFAYPPSGDHSKGCWERLYIRRPAFGYGDLWWPRALSPGLGSVSLAVLPRDNLGDTFLRTHMTDGGPSGADLVLHLDLALTRLPQCDYEVGLEMACGESVFVDTWPVSFRAGAKWFRIPDPKLWWPRGYGEPNLYDCRLTLLRDGQVVDERRFEHGICKVLLVPASQKDAESWGQGHGVGLRINGHRNVFVKGVLLGQDGVLGLERADRIERLVDAVCDLGCNAIRCWSGAAYASERLLDLCDERGILVLQDMLLAQEGGVFFSQEPAFCGSVHGEVRVAARRMRQHVSLAAWLVPRLNKCIHNEIFWLKRDDRDDALGDGALEQALAQAAHLEAPGVPLWRGVPESLPMQSPWGVHRLSARKGDAPRWSCSDPRTLGSDFWSLGDDWPMEALRGNCAELFGKLPNEAATLALMSQITQAEHLKELVEAARCDARVHGIVWRQLADPCHMIGPGVLDHSLQHKLAYGYVKRAQQPLLLMGHEDGEHPLGLWASSHLDQDDRVTYWVTDVETDEMVLEGDAIVPAGKVMLLGGIDMVPGRQRCLLIEWRDSAGRLYRNHYLDGPRPISLEQYRHWMALIDADAG